MTKSKFFWISLGLSISLIAANPCYAAQPDSSSIRSVRTIPQSRATGIQAELQTVHVWSGYGVSISYYGTEETIKRVWLDDPSRVLMDVDGCLEGLSNKECKNSGAGLIHLRQIEPLRLRGIPAATNGTLLTVVTQTRGGESKTYNFRVVMGKGMPTYSIVQITPNITKAETSASPSDSIAIATINKGIQVAAQSKWITSTNPLWGKLQKLVQELEAGKNLTTAAQNAGVSQRLIERLLELGSQQNNSKL
ncbi:hypothetical protein G7B40_025250 [Aetokthonos hydrillicola Thurmond2011]|jgi:hypothetical protein|uniref:Uncharacterized protein n=1 Tax=Aetokthonos hydrillicola Thurmond2011 TaxID=2712845 RepID=A0AAP5MA54_9CYAN|nr:hypothetical protein [Aetokthonos hydrillicola]MBO3458435.1 hypothetical protein [Aetokthonos hydrillicola CCALA 1050]MBW4586238.1 hypothetical protein [Aetokthonos hydrillicola CCALA 1050]MDR9897845.1 hypothetical protein [Aetokthonos hydrillicola Thurmond2011]